MRVIVEARAWSPAGSLQGALVGLGVSLLMVLAFGVVVGVALGWEKAPANGFTFFMIFGLTLALIGGILGGLGVP